LADFFLADFDLLVDTFLAGLPAVFFLDGFFFSLCFVEDFFFAEAFFFVNGFFLGDRFGLDAFLPAGLLVLDFFFLAVVKMLFQLSEYC